VIGLLAAVVASLAIGVSAGVSVGAASDGEPSIAFASDRGGELKLWTMGADGASPRLVTPEVVSPVTTAWTADGSRIVVVSAGYALAVGADGSAQVVLSPAFGTRGGAALSPDASAAAFLTSQSGCGPPDPGCELVVARTDGSARAVLTERSSGALGWSPDGREIAYEVRAGSESEVWRAAADGSGATRLVGGIVGIQSLAWLVDGTLVLVVGTDIAPDLYLYRPGDDAPTPLEEFACGDSCWVDRSPDGKRFFVFTSGAGSPNGLRVYDLSSKLVGSVRGGKLGWPAWAPDSGSLVYGYCDFSLGQMPPGPCEVQRLDTVTGRTARLLPGPESMPLGDTLSWYGGASFAPDGTRLAVSSYDETGKRRIWVIAADGSTATPITGGAVNDVQPAWQPAVAPRPPVEEPAPNPGFESDPAAGWSSVHQGGGRASFAWVIAPVHGGSHAVAITSSRSSTSFARWITSGRIPVRAGQGLRFEGWLKAAGIAGSGRIDMTFFDREGAYIPGSAVSSADGGQALSGTRDWTQLSVQGAAPARARSVRLEIRLYGTGALYADDVSLATR
jgi:Tol biopolymer transport system component